MSIKLENRRLARQNRADLHVFLQGLKANSAKFEREMAKRMAEIDRQMAERDAIDAKVAIEKRSKLNTKPNLRPSLKKKWRKFVQIFV